MKFTIDPKCIRRGPKELRLLAEALILGVKNKFETTMGGSITSLHGVFSDEAIARHGRAGMYCYLEIDEVDWALSLCVRMPNFRPTDLHYWCGYAQARIEDLLRGVEVPIDENVENELAALEYDADEEAKQLACHQHLTTVCECPYPTADHVSKHDNSCGECGRQVAIYNTKASG